MSSERLLRTVRWAGKHGVLVAIVAYFLLVWPLVPDIARADNLALILSGALPLLLVAMGEMIVLVAGAIDLSVTSIVALASVGGARVMVGMAGAGFSPWAAMVAGALLMLAIGAVVGLVNGIAVAGLAMPPFIVTLATMMFGSGLAVWSTRSKGIAGLPGPLAVFSQEGFGVLAYALILVVPVVVGLHFLLTRTLRGQRLMYVGGNERAARVSGIRIGAVKVGAFVVSGTCAGMAAILYTGRLETGSPVMGQRIFLDVIGVVVIGGTSLFGGRGSTWGTVLGVLFITLVDNSLNLFGVSSFAVLAAKGTIILVAACLDTGRGKRVAGHA